VDVLMSVISKLKEINPFNRITAKKRDFQGISRYEKMFFGLRKYFDKPLYLNSVNLVIGYEGFSHYDTTTNNMKILMDSPPALWGGIKERTDDEWDQYVLSNLNCTEQEELEKVLKIEEVRKKVDSEFTLTCIHELTHKYAYDFLSSHKDYVELKKIFKGTIDGNIVKYAEEFEIPAEDYSRIVRDESTEGIVDFSRKRLDFIKRRLEKDGLNASIFVRYSKIQGLDENLARAHASLRTGVNEYYFSEAIGGYSVKYSIDLEDNNNTINRLAKSIKKNGLSKTLETEYQRIMSL